MITVAGIGPGNPKLITEEVKEAIIDAESVIAFGRVSESLKDLRKDYIKVKSVNEILNILSEKENVLILASGDPCFYGILEYLKKKDVNIDNVLPGISSFQYMMGRLKKSWNRASFLSLHGRYNKLENVNNSPLTIILTDKNNTPSKISKSLHKLGLKGKIYAGFNLSYSDEKIVLVNIGDDIEDISSLAVVVVENEMD
ncbi:precorrin-6y C5,15-methyltransferase (decarboxylating) subunit CbiE [Anaerosalibacter massiliensis]|uniref:Precorrin-6y C5,15-methyltransferase (Decarboxylating) subunit CbiE n=1 Tax=Anaerosalibacter massiliensis TaxID=1347392 RepID=A0A9X2MIS0_9FIRM|nr:precorrin-6y C5,15-methyltransferase (decarboxylating) subunit CbiE [Anaerosalibacter massiliensis]MCR2043855.1 precorrin-6y C5,15-methyltransferase (decarboxylating) subunit CbiE [Anaerosalibacter massiliensis]